MFPTFDIFGRQIGTYGVMVVLGIAACFLVARPLVKRADINIYDFSLTMIAMAGALLITASLVYGMTNIRILIYGFSHFDTLGWSGLWDVIKYAFGGIVFYGGFIGGGIGILIYTKYVKDVREKRGDILDIYAVLTPLFHTFGRIGCFLGGCCYGVESKFGITVHGNTVNPTVNDVNRFPIQLVEAGCNLILFFVLLYLLKKGVMKHRMIYLYMLTYPVIRFIDEFFRGDFYRGIFFGLSTSQWISIGLFVFAIVMLPLKTKKLGVQKAKPIE